MKEVEDKIEALEKEVLVLKSLIQAEVGSAGVKGNLTRHIDSIYQQIEVLKNLLSGSNGLEMRVELLRENYNLFRDDTKDKFGKIYSWVKAIVAMIVGLLGKALFDLITNGNTPN